MQNTISPQRQDKQPIDIEVVRQEARDSFAPNKPEETTLDPVEDMLVLSEDIKVCRNYLAQRWHEIQPEDPADLAPEHHERIISHARFLKELGRISAEDWNRVGLGDEALDEVAIKHLAEILKSQDSKYISILTRPNWQEHFPTSGDEESTNYPKN